MTQRHIGTRRLGTARRLGVLVVMALLVGIANQGTTHADRPAAVARQVLGGSH